MAIELTHAVLGSLRFENGLAETSVHLDGESVEVDVTFDGDVDGALLDGISVLADLAALAEVALSAVRRDIARHDEAAAAQMYRDHLFRSIEHHILVGLFGAAAADGVSDDEFVARLELERIGVYPEDEDESVVCDFTVAVDVTNYVLIVPFSLDGKPREPRMES